MKKSILVIIFTIVCLQLVALGAFNLFNQRNHSELKWHEISTKNCRIVYHEPLLEYAVQSADIAQESFDTYTKAYGIIPNDKMIIYISNQDNIANGAALLNYYIFIWVNQNDFTQSFTGNDKWLRKVIAHEAAHWFVAQSLQDWMSPYLPINALTFPITLNEGFAQFFSGEPWGYNRGDRFLRNSVYSHTQKVPSGMFEGGLMYGAGFSMVRYLQSEYGEEKLMQMLKYRNKTGLYSFEKAFKNVYDKSFEDFVEEWRRHVYTYYYGQAYVQQGNDLSRDYSINSLTEYKSNWTDFKEIILTDDKALFVARKSLNQYHYDLVLANVSPDSLKKNNFYFENELLIDKANSFASYSLSENKEWVAYSLYTRVEKGKIAPRIYLYSIEDKKKIKLIEGNHVQVDNAGGVYFQKLDLEYNKVYYRCPLGDVSVLLQFSKDAQVGELKLSPNGENLAVTLFDEQAKFKISVYDVVKGLLISEQELPYMAQSISWYNDNVILISTEKAEDFKLTIYRYDIDSKNLLEYQTPPYNISPIKVETINDTTFTYGLVEYYRGGFSLGKTLLKEKDVDELTINHNYYTKWIDAKPNFMLREPIPEAQKSDPIKYNAFKNIAWRQGFIIPLAKQALGTFIFSEPLGKHTIVGTGLIPYDFSNKKYWMLAYTNNSFYPTINLVALETEWFAGYENDKLYFQNMKKYSLTAEFPANTSTFFSSMSYGAGIHYSDIKKDKNDFLSHFEDAQYLSSETFINYKYNLPWRNSSYHPVKKIEAGYRLQNGLTKYKYTQNDLQLGLAFAPFLNAFKNEQLKTISLSTQNNIQHLSGEQLKQFMPGIDQYEFFQVGTQPAFNRFYLRGYEKTHTSKTLFNSQNEINLKVSDDFIQGGYAGAALFVDYTRLLNVDDTQKDVEYKAAGLEFKVLINLFGFDILSKYGFAYDLKGNKLKDYYMFSLPFGANMF